MGKQKAPAAPNYAPIIAAQSQAAMNSQNMANERYAWAQNQYAADRANTDKVVKAALDTQGTLSNNAAADRARYDTTYVPAEDQFLQTAQSYADPAKVNDRAAAAAGDVSQQFDVARANAQRQLEAYGIDPTQTRAQALDLSTRTQEAAARASAMNTSRRQDVLTGQQMLGQAIGQGQQTAARGLQGQGLALQAGQSAVSNDLATTASGANTMGTAPQYTQIANSSLAGAASTTNAAYQNKLDEYKANQASSSGVGGLLGTGLGYLAKSYDSDGKLASKVGSVVSGIFAADGGVVPDDEELAAQSRSAIPGRRGLVHDDTHAGIRVTRQMSPSGGLKTDDVPARLNAGEFVLPRDTVDWYGQRFLQNLIRKGVQESAGATRPRVAALPVERPAIDFAALDVRR
ncbi:hypothetical protein [Methylobacterium fujisawaense]|uniref:hypothetical protein n=1 Tax=Methylobacterium fujisawaense TaxID=107400 RepID=UPI00313E3605